MKLSDLKKYSARKRAQISFQMPNGMECVIDKHGVARIPQLKDVPGFNLEEMVEAAKAFAVAGEGERARTMARAEVEKLISSLGGTPTPSTEHDE